MAAASLVRQTDDGDPDTDDDTEQDPDPRKGGQDAPAKKKRSFKDRLRDFFSPAPRSGGADLDW